MEKSEEKTSPPDNKTKPVSDNLQNNIMCPHQHARTEIIKRNYLTRKQYTEMLATPKGVQYEFKGIICRGKEDSYVKKKKKKKKKKELKDDSCYCTESECDSASDDQDDHDHDHDCSEHKHHKKKKRKHVTKSLKPCDKDNPYVHNFLADLWSILTPDNIDNLRAMLTKEFGMNPRDAEEFLLDQRIKTLFKGSKQIQDSSFPCFPFPCPDTNEQQANFPCSLKDFLPIPRFPPDFTSQPFGLASGPPTSKYPPPQDLCFPPQAPPSQNFCFPPPCPSPPPMSCFPPCSLPCPLPCDLPCPPFKCKAPCPCPIPPPYPCESISTSLIKHKRKSKSKVKCKKFNKKQLGLRYYWVKNMVDNLSIVLNDYVAMMLSRRRSKRVRCISELILKQLCDLTGEVCTLNTPKTRAQKMLVFISDRIAIWLARISCTCDEQTREICAKNKGTRKQGGEGDDEDEDGGEEGDQALTNDSPNAVDSGKKEQKNTGQETSNDATTINKKKEGTDESENIGKENISSMPKVKKPAMLSVWDGSGDTIAVHFNSSLRVGKNKRNLAAIKYDRTFFRQENDKVVDLEKKKQADEIVKDSSRGLDAAPALSPSERADEIASVLSEKLVKAITHSSVGTNKSQEVVAKVSKSVGTWIDKFVTEAETEIVDSPAHIWRKRKIDFSLKNSEYFFTHAKLAKLPSRGPQNTSREKCLKNHTEEWEKIISDFFAKQTQLNKNTDSVWYSKTDQSSLQKLPLFDKEEMVKWKIGKEKHAMKWKQNKVKLSEAAKLREIVVNIPIDLKKQS